MLSIDWTERDVSAAVEFSYIEDIDDPTVPIKVWGAESDNRSTAHNPNGDASGLFQIMPATAVALGWRTDDPHLFAFRGLRHSRSDRMGREVLRTPRRSSQ